MTFVKVARVDEIPDGKMKHVEVSGTEIMVANVHGKFHAVSDRCGHMNVLVSMGTLLESTLTCPAHYARFDVTNGKVITGPQLISIEEYKRFNLPPEMMKVVERMNEFQSAIKTHDLQTFKVQVKGDDVLVDA